MTEEWRNCRLKLGVSWIVSQLPVLRIAAVTPPISVCEYVKIYLTFDICICKYIYIYSYLFGQWQCFL